MVGADGFLSETILSKEFCDSSSYIPCLRATFKPDKEGKNKGALINSGFYDNRTKI
jgi:hypothetical protein